MLGADQHYILWITLISLLSPCIKSATFKNWLGDSFTSSSNTGVWQKAKDSSGWDQSTDVCMYYNTGSSGTDDMECSNPVPGQNEFEGLWDPSCKIHDVCLKTNGRSASQCDDDFCDNMDSQCGLLASSLVSGCKTVADLWCTAVKTPCWLGGSCHQGGVERSHCLTPPKTLTIYCDNWCDVFRTEATSSSCSFANRGDSIAFVDDWQQPLEVSIAGITSSTTICILATDNGSVGGIMACIYYNGWKYCTKNGGYWQKAGGLSMIRTPYGSGAWGYNFIPCSGVTPEAGAAWWWANGKTYNTMLFRFQFKNIISGVIPEPHFDDPSSSPAVWTIDISSLWLPIIGGLLLIMLLFNIICLINYQYTNCCKSNQQYHSVKRIDSEFYDTDTENINNPINV